jgi:transcriptional regulator with XRE-family HTH domain
MTPQETFVTRLRRYRQRNQVSLEEIAQQTNVKQELLEALESNDLSEWPRGLYARAWIRAYATAVGLDPVDTVDEFCRLFPHGDRRAKGTIREIAAIVAAPSEYRDDIAHDDRRQDAASPGEEEWHAPLKQAARTLKTRLATTMKVAPQGRRTPRTQP